MNKTVLVIGIIFLLIGVSVVSSTGTVVEDTHIEYPSMDSIDVSEEELSSGKIAYGSEIFSPYNLVKFPLDDPSNIEIIGPGDNTYFLPGGTWSYEHGWFACEYNSGGLWLIDPETGWMENIGGGGVCSELAWDDWTSELYSACIQGLAFNSEGICYGVSGQFSNFSLYLVDFDPYEETLIGPLINFTSEWVYNLDAEFDKDTDILYILSSDGLYTCDTETCECTYVGNTGGLLLSAFAIPYEDDPPVTTISFEPQYPDGENGWYISDVNVTLNATDDMSGVKTIYYKIPGEDWKSHSGDSIKILLDHDCLKGFIEFYSVDTEGNQEEIKSADINIDQLPPPCWLWFEVIGGSPQKGWIIEFTAYIIDNCSGADGRIEFFLNGGLQSIVTGAGPYYQWSWTCFFDLEVDVGIYCCDIAGNCEYYEITIKSSRNNNQLLMHPLFFRFLERFPLLQKLLLLYLDY